MAGGEHVIRFGYPRKFGVEYLFAFNDFGGEELAEQSVGGRTGEVELGWVFLSNEFGCLIVRESAVLCLKFVESEANLLEVGYSFGSASPVSIAWHDMYEYVTEKKHYTSNQQEPETPAEGFVFFGFGIHSRMCRVFFDVVRD